MSMQIFHLYEVVIVHIDGTKSKFISSSIECDTNIAKQNARNNDWKIPIKYIESVTYVNNSPVS